MGVPQPQLVELEQGSGFQLDRMFKEPKKKREQSLILITGNRKIYFPIFHANNQLICRKTYELNPQGILMEAGRQLDTSKNNKNKKPPISASLSPGLRARDLLSIPSITPRRGGTPTTPKHPRAS